MSAQTNNDTGPDFAPLRELLLEIPAIRGRTDDPPPLISTFTNNRFWWVTFPINVQHPLHLETLQWFAWILNGLSLRDPLPTGFLPRSSCPYLNGPPEQTLGWVIDCPVDKMSPVQVAGHLRYNLPKPLDSRREWKVRAFAD